jgi:hypothetical protein
MITVKTCKCGAEFASADEFATCWRCRVPIPRGLRGKQGCTRYKWGARPLGQREDDAVLHLESFPIDQRRGRQVEFRRSASASVPPAGCSTAKSGTRFQGGSLSDRSAMVSN